MAASKRTIRVGIIAEEDSDVDVVRLFLRKIIPSRPFGVSSFVGHGCGKLRYKCKVWANQLSDRGCSVLLVVHDLDRANAATLRAVLEAALAPSPIRQNLIVIPIEELEAWLLTDSKALRTAFNLKKRPKCPTNPESVRDPKECLEEIVWKTSEKSKRYVNSIHNVRIAAHVSLASLRKCTAFRPLEAFWTGLKAA